VGKYGWSNKGSNYKKNAILVDLLARIWNSNHDNKQNSGKFEVCLTDEIYLQLLRQSRFEDSTFVKDDIQFLRAGSVRGMYESNNNNVKKPSIFGSNSPNLKQAQNHQNQISLTKNAIWQMFAVLLEFATPNDPTLREILSVYFQRTVEKPGLNIEEQIYLQVCQGRLMSCDNQSKLKTNRQHSLIKPTLKEVEHSIYCIKNRSLFGNTINSILIDQNQYKTQNPHHHTDLSVLKIPWIAIELSNAIIDTGGLEFEGIFRVPGDIELMTAVKLHLDEWQSVESMCELLKSKSDPAVFSGLLKSWYRELEEPIFPKSYYHSCSQVLEQPDVESQKVALEELLENLRETHPNHHTTLVYLVRFLQKFTEPEVVGHTKMPSGNLAMVWAPNLLRCPTMDAGKVLEYSVKEMKFVRLLIENWKIV
jgi:hypothetical protein